jgi:CIC family chloride channel protein
MGAFVAGCSRTPISAMFLAFALTKDLLILKPILVACLTSFVIARLFHPHSIYERQMGMELDSEGRMQQRLNRHRRTFPAPTPPRGPDRDLL